jgi:hypothetical protein
MKFLMGLFPLVSLNALASERVKLEGKMYIASGFDDNDLVEVAVVGILKNSCYTNPTFEIERNDASYVISLYAQYYKGKEVCRDTNLPYLETISFGLMRAGKYEISFDDPKGMKKEILKVKKAPSILKDDFIYGNVTGIVENEFDRTIEIVGVNPTNCMVLEKIQEEVQKNLVVIRPEFSEKGFCQMKPTPFKVSYKVPVLENNPRGIMLHIRIMDGRSYNYLFQSWK